VPIIADALSVYSREKGCALDDELRVGLIMHIACLANRVAQQQLSQTPQELTPQLSAVPCLLQLNQQFGLNFTVEDIERLQTLFAKYTP
jgi:transcriptional regulatory protein LevR